MNSTSTTKRVFTKSQINKHLEDLCAQFPNQELQDIDFHSPDFRKVIKESPSNLREAIETGKAFQRVKRLGLEEDCAVSLMTRGMDSAHAIANLPAFRFIQEHKDLFDNEEEVRSLHYKAQQIKGKVKYLVANIRDTVAAPHYRTSLFQNVDEELVDYVTGIPSYQDLFGTLDFCSCKECNSIIGPAAYFLDIMRVVDQYITVPGQPTIPEGYSLPERRPDLFEIKLDCSNTNTVIPFLQIVNEVMIAKLEHDLQGNPFHTLALAQYPFNLPFLLPLARIREYLAQTNYSLADIFKSILSTNPTKLGFSNAGIAREYMSLGPGGYTLLTSPDDSVSEQSLRYGLTDISNNLPAKGDGTITIATGELIATGAGVDFQTTLIVGQQIAVDGQVRTVITIDSATQITVDVAWSNTASAVSYTVFPIDDITITSNFLYRSGLELPQLEFLFRQNLSDEEFAAGISNSFFINNTGENLPPLEISFDPNGDTENPVTRILGIYDAITGNNSFARLDRLTRFIRLAAWTGIDYENLNWVMNSSGVEEITSDFIMFLASLRQLGEKTGMSLLQLSAFLSSMKTIGKGNGANPADLFDQVYNNAKILQGKNPYTSASPIPFDPKRPLAWNVGEVPENPLNSGTAQGGDTKSITLVTNASSVDGYFQGMSVTIIDGTGKGQIRVIETYTGADKKAEVYTDWVTVPDATSQYQITNQVGMEDRLVAALQVKKNEMTQVGAYLSKMLNLQGQPILLTLENLTFLYRLTVIPNLFRLTIDEYFCLLSLLFYPDRPCDDVPAGLLTSSEGDPDALLSQLQVIVEGAGFLKKSDFSIYELGYVIAGKTSRYLRLPFEDKDIPPMVQSLAITAEGSLLTAEQLTAAGLDEETTSQVYEQLVSENFINSSGVILWDEDRFDSIAELFPLEDTAFEDGVLISESESKEIFGILQQQNPPILVATQIAEQATLGIYYNPNMSLDFLFIEQPESDSKKQKVRNTLNSVLDKINFTLYAPFLAVQEDDFISAEITLLDSQNTFVVLAHQNPPIIIASDGETSGPLNSSFNQNTPLDFLFDSKGMDQSRLIDSYDGASRTANINEAWDTVPDFFSVYRIVSPQAQGTVEAITESTVTLESTASDQDGFYNGMEINLLQEGLVVGSAIIVAYDGQTRIAEVNPTFDPTPPATIEYSILSILSQGTAQSATADTLVLSPEASSEDAVFDGFSLEIIPDPEAEIKRSQVQDKLLSVQSNVQNIIQILSETQEAQEQEANSGLASFLSIGTDTLPLLIPFASNEYSLAYILPGLLSPELETAVSPAITSLVNGLSRAKMLREKVDLTNTELMAITRRPDHFKIDNTHQLNFTSIYILEAFKSFIEEQQDEENLLLQYFDIPISNNCPDRKVDMLNRVTGWDKDQICQLIGILADPLSQSGLSTMQGVLRLNDPFQIIEGFGVDASYLSGISNLASLTVGQLSGALDEENYQFYDDYAEATLSSLAGRYGTNEFDSLNSKLISSLEVAKRDALLGFTIWHLQQEFPTILRPSDLFKFLLIDVEMSGCDSSSYIASGITSVQLYMQRVRMGLEIGANSTEIPEIWFTWLSAFRVWQVNRQIFLYPENFIEPALRKGASPAFESLIESLRQANLSEATVQQAYLSYFDNFELYANLIHVGAYNASKLIQNGEVKTESIYFIARTHTTPYTYYWRTFEKSSNCNIGVWSPWLEISTTVDSDYVSPVFVFDRLFIFWTSVEFTKSSSIQQETSNSQSVSKASLKYSFQNTNGDWVAVQTLSEVLPIVVDENTNPVIKNSPYLQEAYENAQHYWAQPYPQSVGRGIPATGTLNFIAGFNTATGNNTSFERQIKEGDFIWSAGERRRVVKVDSQQLLLDQNWTVEGTNASFKVIPLDQNQNSFHAFNGPGKIIITEGTNLVAGQGTNFIKDFQIGDDIQTMGETRTVVKIDSNPDQILVNTAWTVGSNEPGLGTISVFAGNATAVGDASADFEAQLEPGDVINVQGQEREVFKVVDKQNLFVTANWGTDANGSYSIVGSGTYTAIPRANGAERLFVVYGPNLITTKAPSPDSNYTKEPNPGDDPFIASLNQYNEELNQALTLNQVVNQKQDNGNVAGTSISVLGADLVEIEEGLYSNTYETDSNIQTPPVRPSLNRENDILNVVQNDCLLENSYWGNSTPGTTINQPELDSVPNRPLLYHVNSKLASVYGVGNQPGWFLFNNTDQSYLISLDDENRNQLSEISFLKPYSITTSRRNLKLDYGPLTTKEVSFETMKFRFTRLTTSVVQTLKQRVFAGGIDLLLKLSSQELRELPFDDFYEIPGGDVPTAVDANNLPSLLMNFDGAYGLYFWEIFFHAPLLIADQLATNQDFEGAKKWFEYIFDPNGQPRGDESHPNDRYYNFRPFRTMDIPNLIDILTNQCEINAYNNDPFNPDAIAQLRISAYAKATVIKYIKNLIAWGDMLFAQDSRESINQALNLYVLAQDLLGSRPEEIYECPVPDPLNFNEIKAEYPDGIPEFYIQAENTVFITSGCVNDTSFAEIPYNDIDSYFCVPENKELISLFGVIEDRLYKIRHCLNLQGVARPLALFAPPIDPHAFIRAFGSSGSSLSAMSYSPIPVPYFRFTFLVGQAKTLISEVISLGASMLSVLEKKDAEALAMLQNTHTSVILDLTTSMKQDQIKMIEEQGDALAQSLASATARKTYYSDLIDAGLNPEEIAQIVSLGLSAIFTILGSAFKTAAAIGYAVPQVGSPFAMTYGGQQLGANLQNTALVFDALSTAANFTGTAMGLSAGYSRREEEWEFQKNLAEIDEAQFEAQISANETQKKIAEQDLTIHNTQIEQNKQIEEFMKKKFTNEALYSFMANRLSGIYFQAYKVAIEMARQAERAYQYEYNSSQTFINFGYWDNMYKGLTAGEGLLLALNQMEKTYTLNASRSLEIQRTISLSQIDPLAFLALVETGECIFNFTEQLFDADYPGQYKRKIKTLSVTIPAIVGPYQNIKATLTQTSNQIIISPDLGAVQFLLGIEGAENPPASVLQSNVNNFQKIALSTGQSDNGQFQMDLGDTRYLPFEGTGAISSWTLSLRPENNAFDFSTISDVIINLSYTAYDGGEGFRKQVDGLLPNQQRTWSNLINLKQQYASDWFAFMDVEPTGKIQEMKFNTPNLEKPNVKNAVVTGFYFQLIVPDGVQTKSSNDYISLKISNAETVTFSPSSEMNSFYSTFLREIPLDDLDAQVEISFDLDSGFTPTSLKVSGENRLNPEVVEDIILVFFLMGED